jgi:hypothetical protein
MPPRRTSRRAKAGVTLVEVMLAGAITILITLSTLEGFIVAAKIAHENAEALRADGIAFDLLWRKFYGDYETMTPTMGWIEKETDASTSPYRLNYSASSSPPLPSYTYYESTTNFCGGKILSVELKYGASQQYTRHLEVFRSSIPRAAN